MSWMHKWVRFLVWTGLIIGAIIGLARAVAIRWYRVPTSEEDPYLVASLSPSIRGGDLILLWRLTKPDFGDLVMCPDPEEPSRVVIGRIAAEEDDRIRVESSHFFLNDKRSATERGCNPSQFEAEHPGTGEPVQQQCQIEVVKGHSHMRGTVPPDRMAPSTDAKEVPPEHVYLLSDNRLFPYDSREYGTVERSTCTETVVFRLVGARGWGDSESRLTFIQ
jgi:signal peptidase I